jgi:adenylate cyclase
MNRLLGELLRRNVLRVAAAYLIVAWLILQVVSVMTPARNLPDWVDGFLPVLLIAGFPLAPLLAWAFELPPKGVRLTAANDMSEAPRPLITTDLAIIGLLVVGRAWTTKGRTKTFLIFAGRSQRRMAELTTLSVIET